MDYGEPSCRCLRNSWTSNPSTTSPLMTANGVVETLLAWHRRLIARKYDGSLRLLRTLGDPEWFHTTYKPGTVSRPRVQSWHFARKRRKRREINCHEEQHHQRFPPPLRKSTPSTRNPQEGAILALASFADAKKRTCNTLLPSRKIGSQHSVWYW